MRSSFKRRERIMAFSSPDKATRLKPENESWRSIHQIVNNKIKERELSQTRQLRSFISVYKREIKELLQALLFLFAIPKNT